MVLIMKGHTYNFSCHIKKYYNFSGCPHMQYELASQSCYYYYYYYFEFRRKYHIRIQDFNFKIDKIIAICFRNDEKN